MKGRRNKSKRKRSSGRGNVRNATVSTGRTRGTERRWFVGTKKII